MPAASSTTNRSAAAERKIKLKKKRKPRVTYTGPTAATKRIHSSSPGRPAPAHQPGPFTDKERKKVEKNRSTSKYQRAIRAARKHGPATRRGTGPGEAKGDAEFKKGQDYVRSQYKREVALRLIRRYNQKGAELAGPGAGRYREGTTVPPDVRFRVDARKYKRDNAVKREAMSAPVLKALDQTTRPIHALAAGEVEAIKGLKRGKVDPVKVGKAALEGLKNKNKATTRDVLKEVGVKNKTALAVGGFAGDVLGDPTTYVTFGASSVAKKAALDAAKAAERKALKAGLTREQAERMGHRAARQAAKKASKSRGVTVSVGSHEVPGVRRATAKAGEQVKRATDKVKVVRKSKDAGRHLAADFNPNIVPDNISREAYGEVRRATRTARSTTAREVQKTKERAASVKRAVKGADQEILDAVENGSWRKLPAPKRDVAKRLIDQFKYARRLERRAGIPVKERKGYVPHQLKNPESEGKRTVTAVGAKKITPSFSKARKEQRTLAEIRRENPDRYHEDAAVLYANRLIESHVASNKAKLNRRLLDMGRRVRRGDTVEIGVGEKVFNVKGSDIREVTDKREMQRFVDSGDGGKGGQYVILNEQTVNRAVKNVIPASDRTAVGAAIDKVQGGWKWLATVPNIGFHVRNAVGDAQNAYLAESAPRLARNTAKAARVLKAVGKQEEHRRKSLPGAPPELKSKGVKVDGKTVSYHDLINEAESVGAIRSGFINRELPELAGSGKGVSKVRKGSKAGRSVKRFVQNREDLFRLATYIGGRNRGLSPEAAAERAAHFHFDYADLTQLERTVLRRVMPFYTFSARNIPLQLTSYMTRPGKFAAYQKVRENVAKAFGIDLDEAEDNMTEYEQRSAPIVIKWKGHEVMLSLGPSGLPLTDLNELPVSADPTDWADEWFQRATSLLSPVIKTPLEMGLNYSFFFRDQIERDEGPLVPAPSWVGKLPKPLRDKLGVVADYVDKRTGTKGWGWPAKLDYVANQVAVGPLGLAKRAMTHSDREGEDLTSKLVAGAGVRIRKVDPANAAISRLYDEKLKLEKKRAALNQRGINGEHPNVEWTRLSKQIRDLEDEIGVQRGKRGDKIISKRGRRPGVKPVSITAPPSSSSSSSSGRVLDLGGSSSSSGGSTGRVLSLP